MWIISTAGFFSAVQDKYDSSMLMIRSRDRVSLEAMVDGIELMAGGEPLDIVPGVGTDYPYRVRVNKQVFADWLALEVVEYVDYTNFKSALTEARGKNWANAAMDIWMTLIDNTTDAAGKMLSPLTNRNFYSTVAPAGGRRAGTGKKGKKKTITGSEVQLA